ncbi:uncharacterized protein troap [Stegastes partitus]|uniref:Uncharacterized LOC103368238 n=1 Tax=Stegastes partitus TaxID=144197 RepID=A0A3B4ZK09_9TELE|nr:PREDICTED: uncharacterized protein LOC103368238 [Stegastes partitus]
MDSSSVLRQQSQNKIHSDFQRMKNEHNKRQADPKSSKPMSVSHLSNKDSENKPPGNSEISKKAPVRPGVSRLPVLAKSLPLQTPNDFSQSHSRWEEKPLAGKTKKKKPCTRPVPFNLSQPKNTRIATENQQTVSKSKTVARPVPPKNNVCNAKPTKHQSSLNRNGDFIKGGEGNPHEKTTEGSAHLLGQTDPFKTFKTSATLSKPDNTMHQNMAASSVQPALSAEVCLNNMNLLSLKDSSKTVSQTTKLTAQDDLSEGFSGEKFQPDHAALLSVLRNEGVSVASLASATPHSKPYNYLPQRVSVMKTQQKTGPLTASVKSVQFAPDLAALQSILQNEGVKAAGPVGATPRGSVCPPGRGTSIYTPQRVSVMKSRQKAGPATVNPLFSPDAAALQSILQNEGVKAGGLVGATPRNSECPPGRGTSIYTAQRVPVRKARAEATGGPVAVPLKETPLKKWTPQRVRDTKHQPVMSATKWHLSTQQSPYGTPGLRSCKNNLQPHHEQEVVQRLFDDQEDEQSANVTDKDSDTQAEQLPVQASPTKSYYEEKPETSRTNSHEEEEEEEEQKSEGGQMFLQAPHRESVIFFSTGKKLIRAPHFKKQEISAQQDHQGLLSSEQRKLQPVHNDTSTESEPTSQTNPCVQRLHRDLGVQKTCSLSPIAAMLRKRLPPLEELRMDEEVATYTSVSVPAHPGCLSPRPRCGNPLASILHFEESTRFVPIDFDFSSGPPSPHSSPLQER